MKETESVQDLINALTNLSIDVDVSKLTNSVTSGRTFIQPLPQRLRLTFTV